MTRLSCANIRSRFALSLVLPILTAGCGDVSGTDPLLDDDRGTPLGISDIRYPGDPGNGQLAWSPDGATLYQPAGQIVAVDVSTGDRRSISEAHSSWLRLTADGKWLYASHFVANIDSVEYVVSRYPTAGGAGEELLQMPDDDFIISEGGERVFYPSHDEPAELREQTFATGTTEAVAVESPAPLNPLSPDGGHVATWGTYEVWRVDLADGSAAPVWSRAQNAARRLEGLRWTDDGRIRLLIYGAGVIDLFEEGVGTRSVAVLSGPTTFVASVGWSVDGETE